MCLPRKLDYARYFFGFFVLLRLLLFVHGKVHENCDVLACVCVCGRRSWQTISSLPILWKPQKCDSSRNWQEIKNKRNSHTHTHSHASNANKISAEDKYNRWGWFGCTHFLSNVILFAHTNSHVIAMRARKYGCDCGRYVSHFVNDVACQTEPSIARTIVAQKSNAQTNERTSKSC